MSEKMKPIRSLEAVKDSSDDFFDKFNYNKEKGKKKISSREVTQFKKTLRSFINSLIELEFITLGETNEIVNDLLKKGKKAESKVRNLLKEEDSTNDDLQELALDLHSEINESTPVIEYEFHKKDIIDKKVPVSTEAIEAIAKAFKSTRKGKEITDSGVSIFDINLQPKWNEGDYLLTFKNYMESPYVHTYGTGNDVEAGQSAKEKGVDRVAKGGIDRMSNNTFDIMLYMRSGFSFYGDNNHPWTLQELFDFRVTLDRKALRSGGYIIFNLPYYKIPHFEDRINLQLKVEGIFRTDDELGNMIFVTTYKKADELSQKKLLKKAFRMPGKMPHYSEVERFYCNKGELILPEIFDGNVRDERDYVAAFEDKISPFQQIRERFKPKETIVELSNPLQKYRFGHMGGVAASGVANGIYDTSLFPELTDKGFNHPHILSFKIIKKNLKKIQTDVVAGKEVDIESWQKTHSIVMEALYPDGTIKEFLNTDKSKKKKAE